MPRYVKTTDVINTLSLFYNYTDAERYDLTLAINAVPTADVVELVRCKDCKYHVDGEPGMVYCGEVLDGWVSEDFFCKDGEREGEEDAGL